MKLRLKWRSRIIFEWPGVHFRPYFLSVWNIVKMKTILGYCVFCAIVSSYAVTIGRRVWPQTTDQKIKLMKFEIIRWKWSSSTFFSRIKAWLQGLGARKRANGHFTGTSRVLEKGKCCQSSHNPVTRQITVARFQRVNLSYLKRSIPPHLYCIAN